MARPNLSCIALCFSLLLVTACSHGGASKDNVGTSTSALTSALLGVNIDPKHVDSAKVTALPSVADLQAVGVTRVRIEFKVDNDDLNGAFSAYDPVIKTFHAAGIGVLLVVDYASASGFNGPSSAMGGAFGGYAQRYASRAAAIAAHYTPDVVDTIELWNEPDKCDPPDAHGNRYCPRLEPADFVTLLRGAVNAIRPVDGGVTLVTGGLASGEWETYAQQVREGMGQDWDQIDGFGIHPYTFWPYGGSGNQLGYQIDRLTEITDKLLYFTEWGDAGRQADAVQAYLSFFADPAASGRVEHVAQAYVFAWSSIMHDEPDEFGLMGRDGNPTGAWAKFRDGAQAVDSHYGQVTPPAPPPPPDPGSNGNPPPPAANHASRLHGTVTIGGSPIAGVTVAAWGHDWQDYHEVQTDESGIYAFDALNPGSQYNVAVNGRANEDGSYVPIDPSHSIDVRNNVELASGPDGWHGENFELTF
jgi:hypothetical protein